MELSKENLIAEIQKMKINDLLEIYPIGTVNSPGYRLILQKASVDGIWHQFCLFRTGTEIQRTETYFYTARILNMADYILMQIKNTYRRGWFFKKAPKYGIRLVQNRI